MSESRFPDLIAGRFGWVIAGVLTVLVTQLNFRRDLRPLTESLLKLALTIPAAFWIVAAINDRFRFGKNLPPRAIRRDVRGLLQADESAGRRVVFVGHLDSADRRWTPTARAFLLLLLVIPYGLSFTLPQIGYRSQGLLFGLIALELTVALLLAIEPFRGRPLFDHQPGLALLAELARTWPRRPDAKVEAWFVATGANTFNLPKNGGGLESASSRDLARLIQQTGAEKPTLIIKLFDPGQGRGLSLLGPPKSVSMAHKAAKDHWIPHRFGSVNWRFPEHCPPCEGVECVSLLADAQPSAGRMASSVAGVCVRLRSRARERRGPARD